MLTQEECNEIILLCGREGWSQRMVADEFNRLHPDRGVRESTVSQLLVKFTKTGS